jgi:hypothetical protein
MFMVTWIFRKHQKSLISSVSKPLDFVAPPNCSFIDDVAAEDVAAELHMC